MTKGMVFNIQRYSIDDGPGIRTTVFLKGCPLSCRWCSNPESQQPGPEISHRDFACNKCNRCVEVCPEHAISVDSEGIHIDRGRCTACGKCVEVCTPEALKIMGQEMTVDEVMAEILKDVDYYRVTGGGITVSGGEPLAQADFAAALLERCQDKGIHTCLDTSGYATIEALKKVLPYTSLVLFDLKHMDPVVHQRYTGVDNQKILENLRFVVENGTPLIIRIPLIPGINDADEAIDAFAKAVLSLGKAVKVNIMPYHRYGQGKYKMLDLPYSLEGVEPPGDDQLQRVKDIFNSMGLDCEVKV